MDQPLSTGHRRSPVGPHVYSGDRFPTWRGNAFLGALAGLHLRRIELQNGHVTHQEALVPLARSPELPLARSPQRIRDVRQGPDGLLYVLTDAGALLRLEPAL
jgi:glucose/arabinose dehydrogenase